ncbi:MAG: outer membrane beta-barrel protein [Candidatus Kapaibacterium sp.]
MKKTILVIAILAAFFASGNAQYKYKVSVGINAGYSIPVTELANVYKPDFSGEFNVGYVLTPELELLLTTGYSKFTFRNENLNDDLAQLSPTTTMNDVWTSSIIPITAGIRYKFDKITPTIVPYGTAELGAYITNFDKRLGGSIVITGSQITSNSSSKESQTGFGLSLGVGTFFEVTPRLSVDVVVKYNFVKSDFVKDYTITKDTLAPVNVAGISTGMYLTTRAGIIYKF